MKLVSSVNRKSFHSQYAVYVAEAIQEMAAKQKSLDYGGFLMTGIDLGSNAFSDHLVSVRSSVCSSAQTKHTWFR